MTTVNARGFGTIKPPFFNANYDDHESIKAWISAHDVPENFHHYFFMWAIRVGDKSLRDPDKLTAKERQILEGLRQDTVDGSTFIGWLVYYERDLWRGRNLKRTYTTYKDPSSVDEDSTREKQQVLYDLLHQSSMDKKRKHRGLRNRRRRQQKLQDRRLRKAMAGLGTLTVQNNEASAQDAEMGGA
ncbi:MAG: hypothetical protein Q9165_001935 [Trypethelium subeluteriae]